MLAVHLLRERFQLARFERAGHWVHHDRLNDFMALVEPFMAGKPLPQGIAGVA